MQGNGFTTCKSGEFVGVLQMETGAQYPIQAMTDLRLSYSPETAELTILASINPLEESALIICAGGESNTRARMIFTGFEEAKKVHIKCAP